MIQCSTSKYLQKRLLLGIEEHGPNVQSFSYQQMFMNLLFHTPGVALCQKYLIFNFFNISVL